LFPIGVLIRWDGHLPMAFGRYRYGTAALRQKQTRRRVGATSAIPPGT
jgi:hypothetical protein